MPDTVEQDICPDCLDLKRVNDGPCGNPPRRQVTLQDAKRWIFRHADAVDVEVRCENCDMSDFFTADNLDYHPVGSIHEHKRCCACPCTTFRTTRLYVNGAEVIE